MRGKHLHHPWWYHLPNLAVILTILIRAAGLFPKLPARIALHFNSAGYPNGWGTPVTLLIATIAPLLLMFCLGLITAEVHARYERRKQFNWFNLLPPLCIGFFAVLAWEQYNYALSGRERFLMPWPAALYGSVSLILIDAVLEALRPHVPSDSQTNSEREEVYMPMIEEQMRPAKQQSRGFVYWESQDPLWPRLVLGLMFFIFLVSGLTALRQAPPVAILMFALAPCFVLLYGGLCITITQSVLRVKLGRLGLTLRTIKLSEIAEVTVREFNALHDFGGFGIRRGMGGTTAYFYRGSAGVFLLLENGKKILLGSDHPARLAAVLKTATNEPADRMEPDSINNGTV